MQTRNITPSDINQLKEIHAKYFNREFDFPDFLNGYLSNFIITDDNDNIILAGGVKPLTEIVLVTDMNIPLPDRYVALNKALEISEYTCRKMGIDSLHAFVQNDAWRDRLIKTGFKLTKGQSLYLGL